MLPFSGTGCPFLCRIFFTFRWEHTPELLGIAVLSRSLPVSVAVPAVH
jgi:hypothetical protein